MRDERRLMLVLVDERLMLELFNQRGQCFALRLNHPRLPTDSRIRSVHHDYNRRAFAATVESAEFPKVPAGGLIPYFDDSTICEYQARYVVGDRITEWKPMEVAINDARILQEQAADMHASGIDCGLYISQALKAKLEACDQIVDQPPDVAKEIAAIAERYMNGEKITTGEMQKAIGYTPGLQSSVPISPEALAKNSSGTVPITKNGVVIGHATIKESTIADYLSRGSRVMAKISVTDKQLAEELAIDNNSGVIFSYPAVEADGRHIAGLLRALNLPDAVVNGEDQTGRSAAETEAEFFRKSILAE